MTAQEFLEDDEEPQDGWHWAKLLVVRGGQGAIMKLAGCKQKAWLPQEQMRPKVTPSEQEILRALGKPVKIWLDTGLQHTGLPVATMWKEDEEQDIRKARYRMRTERVKELQAQDPNQWLEGKVASVKPFGIFVDLGSDVQVLVGTKHIPEECVRILPGGPDAGFQMPDFDPGNDVELRVLGYKGRSRSGQDQFSCTMLPVPVRGKGGKGKDRERKGSGKHGGSESGYSVWAPHRHLESETTLARQEHFEVTALKPELLEEQYGQRDRRAALARKGFAVVDYATSMQLAEVFKAKSEKSENKPEAARSMAVWLVFENKRKQIGTIWTYASTTTSEKERQAVTLAMNQYAEAVQAGANIQKVDVDFHWVQIKLFTGGGVF
ncbi:unnamed protein product [Effrenium voratum]|nr:unnamed protein product [Effrenium voratum]